MRRECAGSVDAAGGRTELAPDGMKGTVPRGPQKALTPPKLRSSFL